ncbi:FEKKY domain-containing protein [Dokdonia pacifica]|nr:hypothetical protein [Dokdonia pacifica]
MKKKLNISKLLTNLTLILICGMSYGQIEIRGKVISEYTKEPIWTGYEIKPNIEKHPISYSSEDGSYLIEYLEPNKEYEIILLVYGYEKPLKYIVKTNNGITYKDFLIEPNCNWKTKAQNDWDTSKAQFLLFGSIAPIMNTKADDSFEKKYGIEYFDFGCQPPTFECIIMYNEKIAELMDEKYGKTWRDKARKDIIGL